MPDTRTLLRFTRPAGAPDPDQAPPATADPARLDPARLFPAGTGGWTVDGAYIVELVDHRRVDVTRTRDQTVLAWAASSVPSALSAIGHGAIDAELDAREARRA